jgi:uncharacterized protein (DUF58 family)
MLSARGRAVLALGAFCWFAAVFFGSLALYPVAAGLVLAVLLALAWVRVSVRRPEVRRRWSREDLVEGDDVTVELVLARDSRAPLPAVVAHESVGRLGDREVELRPRGRRGYTGAYRLGRVPRGRHRFAPVRFAVADPFGLAATTLAVDEQQALVVYPRLTELERLFFDGGVGPNDGHRLLLRRPVGFELHSVREYQQGESLRRVHWPSTAHRGALMVKELEDAPRDEVAVLLDGDAAGVAGTAPDSSFDAAVRAAGSILLAQVRRGRRSILALNTAGRETQAVTADGPEWQRALELLAAAEPDARTPAAALLDSGVGPAARSLELVVVTSRIEPALVSRLLERALTRRPVALVHVDAASFVGGPRRPEPGLLRLQAAGVPVAVVRRGEDLAEALKGARAPEDRVAKSHKGTEAAHA